MLTAARIAAATDVHTTKQALTDRPRSVHFNPNVFFRSGRARSWMHELPEPVARRIAEKSRRLWGGDDPAFPPEARAE